MRATWVAHGDGVRRKRSALLAALAALATILLLAAACSAAESGSPIGRAGTGESAAGLETFDDCGQLQEYAASAIDAQESLRYGPLEEFDDVGAALSGPAVADQAATEPASEGLAASRVEGRDYSGTNVQEAGVDEADMVKTDGETVVAAVNETLYVLDGSGEAQLLGDVALPGLAPHQLFLDGDTVLAISAGDPTSSPVQVGGGDLDVEGMRAPGSASSIVAQVDISDPASPRVGTVRDVDGSLVAARSIDGTVRLVLSSQPFIVDQLLYSGIEPGAIDDIVSNLDPQVWLPTIGARPDRDDGDRRPLLDCSAVQHPVEPTGLGTVTVVTLDPDGDLDGELDATSVMGDGQTVYASVENLYVASTPTYGPDALDDDWSASTTVHQFDISGDDPATYLSSGTVAGRLLNQFSMSEHDGVLRVATTEDGALDSGTGSQSSVTVLEHSGQQLSEVGKVTGLGPNEDIHSVRFIGDQGYVVTFRQTDPLYVIDLSDPTSPSVEGELKILGYSAYLHPVGDGLLLGVGQDATEEGRRLGSQASLFDVSDPTDPRRLQQLDLGDGASEVEWDHHAFLWWADAELAVVPVVDVGTDGFVGALGLQVDADGIDQAGRINHPLSDRTGVPPLPEPCPPEADCVEQAPVVGAPIDLASAEILRSFVMNGDQLWTVSYSGVKVSALSDLGDLEWISFHE